MNSVELAINAPHNAVIDCINKTGNSIANEFLGLKRRRFICVFQEAEGETEFGELSCMPNVCGVVVKQT